MNDYGESHYERAALVRDMRARGCEWTLKEMRRDLGLRLPYSEHPDRFAAAANDRPRLLRIVRNT